MNRSFLDRREFLARGLLGTLGLAVSPLARLNAAPAPLGRSPAGRCVLIWLNGGPSHLDTFDPKPGAPTGGPFKAIDTTVPGLQLCEHLPKLAQRAKDLAIIRSITSPEADHDRAFTMLHTGQRPSETVAYPAFGAVVAREWSAEGGTLPNYVAIQGSGGSAGFFGLDYAPYVIGDPNNPFDNVGPPDGVNDRRYGRRLAALDALNASFGRRSIIRVADEFTNLNRRARRLMKSEALDAFNLQQLTPAEMALYGLEAPGQGEGENAEPQDPAVFARACVLARRLLERGVRFVEVTLDGWDTHENNFGQVPDLLKQLDPAFAGLLTDLESRGMLEDTLVLCMGEFGRTPVINNTAGRDHWSDAFCAVLAGGGIRGGQVIGATDESGAKVKDRPVTVPDLHATLLAAFGIDGAKVHTTPEGRPIKLSDGGKVVSELIGG